MGDTCLDSLANKLFSVFLIQRRSRSKAQPGNYVPVVESDSLGCHWLCGGSGEESGGRMSGESQVSDKGVVRKIDRVAS